MYDIQSGKDTLVLGAMAGIAAKTVQTVLGLVTVAIYPSYLNCARIAAGLVLMREQVLNGGFWPFLLGLQIDTIVGVVVGVLTVWALQRWGRDHFILKGAMIGLITWALFYITLSRFLSRVYPEGSILHAEIAFLAHIAFGITLTWTAVHFGGRTADSDG